MLCSRVQNLLSAYCDREVIGDEMLRIREHLHGCAACRQEYEALRRVKLLLGSLGPVEPSRPFSLSMLDERARARRRRRLFEVPVRPAELRRWLFRLGLTSPVLLTPGHLAVTGAVALSLLAAGILQAPQPPDAVTAHVPEVFFSDSGYTSWSGPDYAVFYSPRLAPAAYPFYPVRMYAPVHPDELLPPAAGVRPAAFIVPAPGDD